MLERLELSFACGGMAALAGWLAWRLYSRPHHPKEWEEVGEVSDLTIFPLKSGRGVSVKQAQATTHGLAHGELQDRAFMVVTAEEHRFVGGRHTGRLLTVALTVKDDVVTLEARAAAQPVQFNLKHVLENPEIVHARMWGDAVRGVDCGDEVAEWLTHMLYNGATQVRLLYKGNVMEKRPAMKPRYFEFPKFLKTDRMYYADTCAYLVTSQSSLKDLNSRLEDPVTMANFRANITVRGAPPFDEDDWTYLKIGQVVLRKLKPCERCIQTTVDPETGERHPKHEPITTLRSYRMVTEPAKLAKKWVKSPIFGINMAIDVTGPLKVGDEVLVART
ncbi:mitochondrial amidoxime-reducing component 1-like [Panulirus ornatus]|uniref:mitochondrial amidoxime-reducing component 1-like n=1 Tax=Panulirus ornatus TaxID=150431 RepID=UPI003A892363